jgi:hypothetical protein
LHAIGNDSGGRQEQRKNCRKPENEMHPALFGGDADPGNADDQQYLHLHEVAQAEFAFQLMARGRGGQAFVDDRVPR